jgi:uncharacterized protein YndB with AHSA1/START domain
MTTILLRVPVEADPKVAFDALSTADGVKGWWSNHPRRVRTEPAPR